MFEPNENPIVPFESEAASRLADLSGVFQDLGFAADCLQRLRAMREDDFILARSLWTSALIAYSRCFNSGKRFGLDPQILDDLGEGARDFHQSLWNQRSKHIAHSVNPFEQIRIGAMLATAESGQRAVVGIATLAMSLFKPPADELEQSERLMRELRKKTGHECQELTKAVQAEAERESVDDLYRRERLQLRAPGADNVSSPR